MSVSRRTQAVVALLLGLFWAFRSLQAFADPDYVDPQTANDWAAVVTLSVALALIAPAVYFLMGFQERTSARRILVTLVGTAAGIAAVANLVEAVGVEAAAAPFFFSVVALMPVTLVLGLVCLGQRPKWPALVLVLTAAGMVNLQFGGGVLILLAWAPVAIALLREFPAGPDGGSGQVVR